MTYLYSTNFPEYGAKFPANGDIVLTFSNTVVAGKGMLTIFGPNDKLLLSLVPTDPRVTISGKTVTIDPPADLPFGTKLSLHLPDAWLLDTSGSEVRYLHFWFETGYSPVAMHWVGTDANESMLGSDLADTLNGAKGADSLFGNAGDDVLIGGDEPGNYVGDNLSGGQGNDKLYGGTGDDKLQGDEGSDLLDGGEGSDTLADGPGDDRLIGGAGGDDLRDWQGSNVLDGGDGDDVISSSTNQSSSVHGGGGNDWIMIGGGTQIVAGGAGDDKFEFVADAYSQAGLKAVVQVDGGDGNDRFTLAHYGSFDLRLTGGDGIDKYVLEDQWKQNKHVVTDFRAGAGGDVIQLYNFLDGAWNGPSNPFAPGGYLRLSQEGAATVLYWDVDGGGSKPGLALLTMENVRATALTSDNFSEGLAPDGRSATAPVAGTAGDDEIKGDWLDNTIYGGEGNDTLSGSHGNDSLFGQAGNDEIYAGAGGNCKSLLDGGDGDDQLSGGSEHNTVLGGAGNDSLRARSAGTNVLEGGSGDDRLEAGWGIDSLMDGGDGNDLLQIITFHHQQQRIVKAFGGNGNDEFWIYGYAPGTTTIEVRGGAGVDIFDLRGLGSPADTVIHDFNIGEGDQIKLAYGLSDMSAGIGNPFASGLLRIVQNGGDSQIVVSYKGREMVAATLKNTLAGNLTAQAFAEGYAVVSNDAAKTLLGTAAWDTLSGGPRNDSLSGLGGHDVLYGYGGNDRLLGGAGSDELNGGTGIDVAVVELDRAKATIKIDASGKVSVATPSPDYATDTLIDVERIQFNDAHVAVDVNGIGGRVYRMYQAAFDRKPDLEGVGFWMNAAEKGTSMIEIAQGFINSEEFRKLYGANPSNGELIDRFYRNVLDRDPDAAGRTFWVDVLDRKLDTVAGVLSGFSDSAENTANVAKVIGNGFEYVPWHG
jgi:Ca2+-binding RTX toxin-like protein